MFSNGAPVNNDFSPPFTLTFRDWHPELPAFHATLGQFSDRRKGFSFPIMGLFFVEGVRSLYRRSLSAGKHPARIFRARAKLFGGAIILRILLFGTVFK